MNTLNMMALKLYMKMQMILDREEGQDLVEYALLVGLLALAAVASLQTIGNDIKNVFSTISSTLGTV